MNQLHTFAAAIVALALFAAPKLDAVELPGSPKKPLAWGALVEKVAGAYPIFWMDGSPKINRGTQIPGKLDLRGRLDSVGTGFWGDPGDAFGLASGEESPVVIAGSEKSSIGVGATGALALLFRAASDFDGHSLPILSRGTYVNDDTLEIVVVSGELRINRTKTSGHPVVLSYVNPRQWYWLALSWRQLPHGPMEVTWHFGAPLEAAAKSGTFQSLQLGDVASRIVIGGRGKSNSMKDTALSQVIAWDRELSVESMNALYALLAKK
jgi:hypothetical protein